MCSPAEQQSLWSGVLERLAPSPPFRLAGARTAWASTGNRPDQDQLFSGVGGLAMLAVIPAGSVPRPSGDPAVNLRHTDVWVALPIGSGDWRVYTTTLGGPLGLRVVSCP